MLLAANPARFEDCQASLYFNKQTIACAHRLSPHSCQNAQCSSSELNTEGRQLEVQQQLLFWLPCPVSRWLSVSGNLKLTCKREVWKKSKTKDGFCPYVLLLVRTVCFS